VRRGAERYIHELSSYLSRRGYEIKIVTSKPGRTKTIKENGIDVHYWRQYQNPLLHKFGITSAYSFMLNAFRSIAHDTYDLIHSFYPSDGYAAHLYSKVRRIKYILNFNGVPIKAVYKNIPLLHHLMRKAFDSASVIVVNSQYSRRYLKDDYNKEGVVIPGAVDISKFFITDNKDLDRPKVLCTAAIDTRYKNVPLLVKAFELFKSKVPQAVLQLSGHVDSDSAKRLKISVNPRIRESIHILGVGNVKKLPQLYSEASIFVLPSINEAFGSVLVESLASGTPVVGTDSGGIPEIISHPRIGTLYKPNRTDTLPTNSGDLCDAMLQTLELAKRTETSNRCREHAERYDWSVVGAQFEEVYKGIINGGM
jgi:glycosyltransferase involved in cell wall biosynthesis